MDRLDVPLPMQPEGLRHRFHAMIKPIGSQCNLNCSYCYYLSKRDLLNQPTAPRMSSAVLESHIRQYIEAQTGDEVVFSWQGGEPTLLGLEFFENVVELQARFKKTGQRIENDLQTNGTLLDDEWASFLRKHNFLVGLSCDGPRELHDRHRLTKAGEPTHDKVNAAVKLLRKHGVSFNILCVVNRDNAKYPLDIYRYFVRDLDVRRVQFISCVEPKVFDRVAPQHWNPETLPVVGSAEAKPGNDNSVVTDWSVDPEDWGRFLCKVWDDWYQRGHFGKVHVDLFETVVAQSLGLPAQRCITMEFCGKGMAIEHNGDVYTCDHFVYPEYKVGNIEDTHWGEMAYSEVQQRFGFSKRDTLPTHCRNCTFLTLCWGECPKNRIVKTPDGEVGLNYLCPGMKMFFSHIQRDLPELHKQVRQAHQWYR